MKTLWAPWRMAYILSEKKPGSCVFCDALNQQKDEDNYILYRSKHCFVIMNIFPYNPGHIMVVPNRHINHIKLLTNDESIDVFKTVQNFCDILEKAFKPNGLNIGMNLGSASGAGIADHIHFHIVPRWIGDTNFMSTVCDTKVISEGLRATYNKIKEFI
ncbi:MAG: HIT family protein [Desulfurella sp.]|jgi:ATP adenylyltransferase|uniref:Diadenosine tetraphosphate (Ap4A) hydrolase n=1 Tax=Desulfurella multipotens TaxID=79269 RepID=A0A1G6IVC5_9BACT|nr:MULTISPECIES: HIT domain-containing protein [Desulfurella]AHF97505.1 HIT family hydrolase [Desulfurella acetivorans A63]PMP69212.1 MAG: HIT domain-containing protein [Desulfurella multipotens]PMP92619.1 MAG: HIT domain-containing protein [Desulfurella sp.]SDC10457.1 Diadenosine tetraphosphate (Ap4A) hydrolase [Desulfurella multipotens]